MKPKRIVRRKEACVRLGCGRTKFRDDYEHHDGGEPNVPGTEIPRVKAIALGPRNKGFLEHELDELIDGLAALRDAGPPPQQPASRPSGRLGASKRNANALRREQAQSAHEDRGAPDPPEMT
jgi:hypothetical protein